VSLAPSPLRHIQAALRHLNPNEVRRLSERDFTIGLLVSDDRLYRAMSRFLLPAGLSDRKARQAGRFALRVESEQDCERCDFGLAEPALERPAHFYPFDPERQGPVVGEILDERPELWVALARHFVAFRKAVVSRVIRKIARENAVFTMATALPSAVWPLLGLPWSVGEFASDTAFLTMNQIRMTFLLAAASDAPVGYLEQRGQIASVITSAFGWRALARELCGKIPLGGGMVSKAAVAYAGTCVLGLGLERYLRLGRHLTAEEKREQYTRAYQQGRKLVEEMAGRLRDGAVLFRGR